MTLIIDKHYNHFVKHDDEFVPIDELALHKVIDSLGLYDLVSLEPGKYTINLEIDRLDS